MARVVAVLPKCIRESGSMTEMRKEIDRLFWEFAAPQTRWSISGRRANAILPVLATGASILSESIAYVGMIALSLGSQPLSVSSPAKYFFEHADGDEGRCGRTGEAPSRATSDLSSAATSSVPNSNTPPLCWSGLLIWTRRLAPIFASGLGKELAKGRELVLRALQ
jgi:hypothetical protein